MRNLKADAAERCYKWGQVGSASLVALAHGANDAKKTIGVIALVLISGGGKELGRDTGRELGYGEGPCTASAEVSSAGGINSYKLPRTWTVRNPAS